MPQFDGMNDARLEVRLPHERREQLDRMAEASGLTAPTLARLAIGRLIEDGYVQLKLPPAEPRP